MKKKLETCVDAISEYDMELMDLHGEGILSGYTAESLVPNLISAALLG